MGKYSDAVKAKLATLGKAKLGTVEDFTKDPAGQLKEVYLENDEFFIRQEIEEKMEQSLETLPEQKRNEINALNVSKEEKWTAIADAYEEQFGAEAADAAAKEVEGFMSPSDPKYPKEKLVENPFQADTDALRAEIKPDDPEAEAKRALLDKIDKELTVTQIKPLKHFNRLDSAIMPRVNAMNYVDTNAFVDEYQGGKYASKLPTTECSNLDLDRYTFDNVGPDNCTFSSKDSGSLVGMLDNMIPEGLKKDVLEITDKMEQHKEGYALPGKTVFTNKSSTGQPYYLSEQGTKAYAFWPLQDAYEKLFNAVKTKDFDKIREAEEHYSKERKFTDEMMETVGKYKTPLCGGNVNSTRSVPRLAIPTEHIKDFTTHSKLNGIYMLHGLSKNTGLPVKEILNDPVTAMRKSARNFLTHEGLHTKKTLGAKLMACMSKEYASEVNQSYQYNDPSLVYRAYEAMASFESDPKKRQQIAGAGALAAAAGYIIVSENTNKIVEISKMDAAKKDCFYQHAALLPEAEFDPIAVGEKFAKEDWKKEMDPKALVQKLRAEGKLDYNALAGRTERVLEEMAEEMNDDNGIGPTKFKFEDFYQSSMTAYNEVIRTATPEEKQDPAFQKFRDSVFSLQLKNGFTGDDNSIKKAKENLKKFDDQVAVQMKKKSGWFLSSKNTAEHDRMEIAQRKLQYKLKQLKGEPITDLPEDEIAALKKVDLKRLIDKARSETYNYCCLKTKNGRKGFVHDAGFERYDNGMKSLETIDDIANTCGLISPGEKLLNQARREMLNKRDSEEWVRDNLENYAASAILGMTLANGKKTFEEQNKYLSPEKLQQSLDKIKQDPAFRRMMQNEGAEKMCDNIIIGNSSVTDAYIKAQSQVNREHTQANLDPQLNGAVVHGNDDLPPAMTSDDKKKMWGDNPIQL